MTQIVIIKPEGQVNQSWTMPILPPRGPHDGISPSFVGTALGDIYRFFAGHLIDDETALRHSFVIRNTFFTQDVTDADILKHLYVNPNAIEFRETSAAPQLFGVVANGDWDLAATDCIQRVRYKGMREHFVKGMPWCDTSYFLEAMSRLESNNQHVWWGAKNREELLDRFREFDDLYERIRREGYHTQQSLLKHEKSRTIDLANGVKHPILNEIGVNIARDGRLIFVHCGLHRLCIAKCLKLETVPVVVRGRHKLWQKRRDEISTAQGRYNPKAVHPDLHDLVSDKPVNSV